MLFEVEGLIVFKPALVCIWFSEKENTCKTISAVNISHGIKVKFYQVLSESCNGISQASGERVN